MPNNTSLLPHISSIIIYCLPEKNKQVIPTLQSQTGTEVYGTDGKGKIIALIESPDYSSLMNSLKTLSHLPYVISCQLVFHYAADEEVVHEFF
ncbi:chaperone NapD [Zooshikella harenae]|uniref:Chaperone NapD n=1 Tax=Zooshikella harenae TaxID=2827238 RepID=A0ABS5Z9A4_9GAMM|nr:chaperone NapD [Zooshikella harenae]MBU2710629.1 chaperone NapD [Zooshikella harenae]